LNNLTIFNLSEASLVNFRMRNIAKHREKWGRNKTPQISGLGHKYRGGGAQYIFIDYLQNHVN